MAQQDSDSLPAWMPCWREPWGWLIAKMPVFLYLLYISVVILIAILGYLACCSQSREIVHSDQIQISVHFSRLYFHSKKHPSVSSFVLKPTFLLLISVVAQKHFFLFFNTSRSVSMESFASWLPLQFINNELWSRQFRTHPNTTDAWMYSDSIQYFEASTLTHTAHSYKWTFCETLFTTLWYETQFQVKLYLHKLPVHNGNHSRRMIFQSLMMWSWIWNNLSHVQCIPRKLFSSDKRHTQTLSFQGRLLRWEDK